MAEQNSPVSIRRLASLDALTLLYNQAHFRRAVGRRIEQSKQTGLDLTMILLDVDGFKDYNDRFGAQAGDAALCHLADVLQETVRADDLLARYGSDEFAILMTSQRETAATAAERIRLTVEARCSLGQNPELRQPLTASLGVAVFAAPLTTLDEFIERAQQATQSAKQAGKNRVSVATSS
jgi:diguanylate cyclase (GGDEF)-like protein